MSLIFLGTVCSWVLPQTPDPTSFNHFAIRLYHQLHLLIAVIYSPVQSPLFIPGFSSWVYFFSQLLMSSFLEISISMWSLHTYIHSYIHTYIVYVVNNPSSILACPSLDLQSKDLILLPSSATPF